MAAISLVYFCIFIPANLTGARDANMLALFEIDEYAQYPNVIRMLTPGPTPYQTLRNFTVYQHYFYGYPFYFFSALSLLPVRLVLGGDWISHTPWIVAWLRQSINVLPMLAAILILVYLQTRFSSWQRSLGLYLFLLSVPVVIVNNLWWHPDSLVFLFIVLTLFFLDRDALRFGPDFIFAALASGLATGTKHLGVFFILAIPLYLVWGWRNKRISLRRALLLAGVFILLMAAAVVISNPLLLLPQERAEIIATQKLQFSQTSAGIITTTKEPYFQLGKYPQDFRVHYGELVFVLVAVIALVIGILRPQKRLLHGLILAWMVPLSLTVTFTATRRTHYFLPVMLPLFSALANIPLNFASLKGMRLGVKEWMKALSPMLATLVVVVQFLIFLRNDYTIYANQLQREQDSPSLAFYQKVQQNVIPRLPQKNLVVYRDWRIYFPAQPGWQVEMNWDLPNYTYLHDLNPDLILLEQQNIREYSRPAIIEQAANPANMRLIHEFYQNAALDAIPGYKKIFEDAFGAVFLRE